MTNSTPDTNTTSGTNATPNTDFYLGATLHLASDNPEPLPASEKSEPLSASVKMASYRLAAVFGELDWVNPDAA